jgi:ribonuclease P/MRP protein subunit RPP40
MDFFLTTQPVLSC